MDTSASGVLNVESPKEPGVGQITSGLVTQDSLALETLRFVFSQLPAWRDDPDRPEEHSEKRLNPHLCKFLDSRARHEFPMFRFDREEPQVGRRKADLSASLVETTLLEARTYTIYDPILIIECKRLPAPSKDREREYVTGGGKRNGGIQRFKLGLYALEHGLAAMIGYIQDRDGRHWHEKINEWIFDLAGGLITDDCDWKADETLEPIVEQESEGISRYRSIHSRMGSVSSNEIELHHFWIAMNRHGTEFYRGEFEVGG